MCWSSLEGDQPAVDPGSKLEAENRATDAKANFGRFGAVREDVRGMVLTLLESELFATGESTLLPTAQNRLKQLSYALVAIRDREITIEGYADTQGSPGA